MADDLTWEEEYEINRIEYEARMAFSAERRARIYQLHRQGLSASRIARRIGGLAPYRVRKIIAWAERGDE